MSADEQASDLTPTEVIEVVGKTGMHGEAMQIKCCIRESSNQGHITTRNMLGSIHEDDILQLCEAQHDVDSIRGQ